MDSHHDNTAQARVWARVDLDAIAHNVRQIRGLLKKGATLMAVVKDNAYGHGVVPVARACLAAGAQQLGVADAQEGLALRAAGLKDVPILLLGPCSSYEYRPGIEAGLTFALSREEEIRRLAEQTRAVNQGTRRGRRTRVHLLVDTGMGRAGFAPDELWPAVERVRAEQTLELEGVFTHFTSAEESDPAPTAEQIRLFRKLLNHVEQERGGRRFRVRHAAASAATVFFPEAQLDMVRCGVLLHGLRCWPAERDGLDLRPALSLHTRIVYLGKRPPGWTVGYNRTFTCARDSLLAALAVGYASGYRRALSGRCDVLIRGHRLPIVGAISMDYTVVDVTPLVHADCGLPEVDEEVTLIGRHPNGAQISVEELAAASGTIPYIITTQLADRLPRIYTGALAAGTSPEGDASGASEEPEGGVPMMLRRIKPSPAVMPTALPAKAPSRRAAAGN